MKDLMRKYPKLHLWLAADLLALAAYFGLRGNRGWMNALARNVTTPLKQWLGRLCGRTDVSVMEVLCVGLVVLSVGYAAWGVWTVVKTGQKGRAYGILLGAVNTGLAIYAGFCLLWGVNYWTDSFQDLSGIRAQPVTKEALVTVTERFAEELTLSADGVPRDKNGLFSVPRAEILEKSSSVYNQLEQEFPFLTFDDPGVKAMAFSRAMSIIGFTGFYCPYTGESNVNVDSPACLLPSTVAHELAHQRGIASEQECNFLAVLAATTSGDSAYIYSGYLMGFIYLGNALYKVDPDTYWQIRKALPKTVEADLRENNRYWDQFRGNVAEKVSDKVYDTMLKTYGDEMGIQSYGTVVDLLVAYYT